MGMELLAAGMLGMGMGGGFAGSLLERRGILQQAEAQEEALKVEAVLARQEAAYEAAAIRRQGRAELSSQRVAFAKAGVTMDGSPLEVLAHNAAEIEREALNVLLGGESTARIAKQRARVGNALAKQRAGAALIGGISRLVGQGGSLLINQGPGSPTTSGGDLSQIPAPARRGGEIRRRD